LTLPLVTIGLTCFNAQDTISRAIESALAQDWRKKEVVIVDDCSTDNSVEVAEAAAGADPQVRLLCHEMNLGPAGSRNSILANARGEFVAFFDDDDESLPGRISTQVKLLTEYEQRTGARFVACYVSGLRHYPNGYVKLLPAIGSQGTSVPNGPGVAQYLLTFREHEGWFFGSGTPACSLLARHSTFTEVGGFDRELRRVEDVDFAIRLANMGGHFVGASEQLFVQYATVAEDKSPEKNLEAEQRLVEKNEPYLRSIGLYYYALHWPKLRYWHFKRRYGRFALELLGLILRNPMRATAHLFKTGPRRILHERSMRKRGVSRSCG